MGIYAKAVTAGLLAGLSSYQTALMTPGVTALEWVGVAIAAVATFTGVWATTDPRVPVELR